LLFAKQTATKLPQNAQMSYMYMYVVILFWYHLVIGFDKSDW